ncbi:hypothetical protein M406DRAFT_71056 [Cryphonectria parasitica EP155]|uniref:Uncharacterized protein n=1 Tax=Cryphonectria parasitica (strain ATCC 38755 / EP155) TaxID=660469 RepID=A0A9P4Y0G1_CRYP1|nr:uncharacterized protein M406DRAFT_71056 [Cryphonectria parasitica EP155]KAF3764398.1 hypothetical protein M406DRAFT_71056 [Cryphonectria parasitica EP155]
MFGRSKQNNKGEKARNTSQGISWEIPHSILFGIIFALAVAELCFTIDAFVYLQELNKWWSSTERARMGFLIFSCARTIFLSGVYTVAHCHRMKNLMNTMHTIFLVISTILWIVSGVLIHQIWGYVECANAGIPDNLTEFKSQVSGGLSLCHEIKIIEIIAWVIAAVSVLATIPVVKTYMERRRSRLQDKKNRANRKRSSV